MAAPTPRLDQLVRDVATACERAQRPDLKARVDALAAITADDGLKVVVLGEFRAGKGTTINALIGADICPTTAGIEPHGAIEIRHGEHPEARVWGRHSAIEPARLAPDLVREGTFPPELVAVGVGRIEVDVPLARLQRGLSFVDTPSSGGLSGAKALGDLDLVRDADAVLLVTSAAQPFTRSEISLIEALGSLCPSITVVLNKTDFYPSWREIRSLDEQALRDAGLDLRVMPISARLATLGGNDADLIAESGITPLWKHLDEHVTGQIRAHRRREAMGHYRDVLAQVSAPMSDELAALEDPATIDGQVRRVESDLADVERARRAMGGWQTVLVDSFEDLIADTELQTRAAFVEMLADAEVSLAGNVPEEVWPEVQRVTVERTRWILARSIERVHSRCSEISVDAATRLGVADVMPLAMQSLDSVALDEADQGAFATPGFESGSTNQRSFTVLRGAVGGLTMFSILGSFVFTGFVAAAPIGAIVLGRKALRDESARLTEKNRAAARTAVRKFSDEAMRLGNAEQKRMIREGRRRLRDYYSDRADEATRTLNRQLEGLRDARQRAVVQQKKRIDDLRKELARIETLQKMVADAGGLPPQATTPG